MNLSKPLLRREASLLFVVVVVFQTAVAIVMTRIANQMNTLGLGYVALLLWLLFSLSSALYCRRILPVPVVLVVLALGWGTSFAAYILIGYYGLGWIGIMKP